MRIKKIVVALLMSFCFALSHSKEQPTDIATNKKVISKKEVSGTYILTSDYIWRGYSQTTNKPAFQGDLNIIIPKSPLKGLYTNLWFSNVRFLDENPEQRSYIEFDGSIGISNQINKHLSYDLAFHRYQYPGTTHFSYNELTGQLQVFFLTYFVALTNNVYDTGGKAIYYNVGFDLGIPPEIVLNLNNVHFKGGIGHHQLPLVSGFPTYSDYNLELNKTIKNYVFALQWTEASEHSEPFGGSRVTFSVSATF
jgi:uncharacterized protein (TIGR02001 family)